MLNFKSVVLFASIIAFVLAKYELLEDERLSPELRHFIRQTNIIYDCSEGTQDKLNLFRCFRADSTLQSITFRTAHLEEAGPMPLLQEWGDYLCANTTKTVQCYQQYLPDLVQNCLDNNSTSIDESKLEALQGILSVVCNDNGVGMKPKAKAIFKCTEDNFEAYQNCYVNGTGLFTNRLVTSIGVVPYVYEYACRTVNASEACVRETAQKQCGLLDAETHIIVTQLFETIRNTKTCKQAAKRSKMSFDERLYQKSDLEVCPHTINTACPNLQLLDKQLLDNQSKSKDVFANISAPLGKLCAKLPELIACGDKWGDRMASCIFSDVKQLGKQGYRPINQVLRYFCDDYDGGVEVVKHVNSQCLADHKTEFLMCFQDYFRRISEKEVIVIQDYVYMDYENFEDLKEFQKCVVVALNGCEVHFIKTLTNGIQAALDEIEVNKIIYESQ